MQYRPITLVGGPQDGLVWTIPIDFVKPPHKSALFWMLDPAPPVSLKPDTPETIVLDEIQSAYRVTNDSDQAIYVPNPIHFAEFLRMFSEIESANAVHNN